MGKDFQDHQTNLKEAIGRFRQYGLKLKPKKCAFFQKRVEFLGRFESENSIEMSDTDIETVKNWPLLRTQRTWKANYHRAFIMDFARIVPLYCITGKLELYGMRVNKWLLMN